MADTIQLEEVNSYKYRASSGTFNGHIIRKVLDNRQIFQEKIATYCGRVEYPRWLGGVKEIIHMNNTTVGLAYDPSNMEASGVIYIDGRGECIAETIGILERLLNITLSIK
jgi:hypothetical protein